MQHNIRTIFMSDLEYIRNSFKKLKGKSFLYLFLSLPSILYYICEIAFKWLLIMQIKLASFTFYSRSGLFLFFICFLQAYNLRVNNFVYLCQLFSFFIISSGLLSTFFFVSHLLNSGLMIKSERNL